MLTITPAGRRRLVTVCVSLLLGITCAAAVTAALGDIFSIVTPARIMPVGDSITRGTGSGWGEGFRLPLVQRMIVGRYTSDFVGAANHGPPWLYDRNHDGFGGYGIDDITNRIAADLNTHRPDYVLLMIGSNDIQWEWHLDTAPDRLSALIDLITQTRPTANVLVASITPLMDPVMDANARLYNAAIPGIVQAKADAGKRVSFVDMYPVLTMNDWSTTSIRTTPVTPSWLPPGRTQLRGFDRHRPLYPRAIARAASGVQAMPPPPRRWRQRRRPKLA